MLPAGQTNESGSPIEVTNTRIGPQKLTTKDGEPIYIETKITVRQDANGVYIPNSAKTTLIQYNFGGLSGVPIRTLGTREVGKPWVMNQALTDPNNSGLTEGQLAAINGGPTQEDIEKSLGDPKSSLNKGITQHSQAVLSAKLDTTSGDPTPKLPGKDNTQQTSANALGQNKANDPQPDFVTVPVLPKDKDKDREGTKTSFLKDLRYPITISNTQDTLKIDMVEYKPSGLKNAKGQWGEGNGVQ